MGTPVNIAFIQTTQFPYYLQQPQLEKQVEQEQEALDRM